MDKLALLIAEEWNAIMMSIGANALTIDYVRPAHGYIIIVVLLFIVGSWKKARSEKEE